MPEDLNTSAAECPADISGDPVVQTEVDLLTILADFPELAAEISANVTDDMISNSAVGRIVKNFLQQGVRVTHEIIDETVANPVYQVRKNHFKISDVEYILEALYRHYKIRYLTSVLPAKLMRSDTMGKAAIELEKGMQIVSRGIAKTSAYDYKKYSQEVIDNLNKKTESYKSGIGPLDDKLSGGFMMSNFMIIAADTGVGKTLVVTQIMENIAKMHDIPVCFFCLEMPRIHMLNRRISLYSDSISSRDITEKKIDDEHWFELQAAATKMANTPICIIDDAHAFSDICSHIRNLVTKGFKFFVIDYLQLVRMPGTNISEKQLLDDITIKLKIMANTYNVCIIGVSQFHRKDDIRMNAKAEVKKREPELSDMKGSSSLEQNADRVIMLWCPPDEMMTGELKSTRMIKLIVKKDRFGDPFQLWLSHDKINGRITAASSEQIKAYMEKGEEPKKINGNLKEW